jgi:hypothetical protein
MLQLILVMLVCAVLSIFIAIWARNYKKIGFGWALFFSLTLTPAFGFILALLSGDKQEKMKDSLARDYILYMLTGISVPTASLLTVRGFYTFDTSGVICLLAGTGVMGMCFYCLKLAIITPLGR